MASFLALTAFMSTVISPETPTPYSPARRAIRAAYALATIALVGMQPVFTQVPPNRCLSMMATDIPASERRFANGGPAWPVPMTIASTVLFIGMPITLVACQAPPETDFSRRDKREEIHDHHRTHRCRTH